MIKKWLSLPKVQVFLALVFLLSVRFSPFFSDQAPIFGDNFSLMVPGKIFTAQWLKQGIIPLWNPTILGGIPWVGDINQSIFYPSTLLFTIFSPGWALNINLLFHLSLTFIGTYLLAKKLGIKHWGALVAAVIWTLSPQLTGTLNNISIIQSLAWVPWIVLAGINLNDQAKTWFKFSLLVTAQFLAGYPQHIIFTIALSVIFALFFKSSQKKTSWFKWLRNWFMTGSITIGMSSFLWLPFLENLLSSTRMIQSSDQLTAGSLHPTELIKLIFPYLFEKPTAGYRWGANWNGFPNPGVYVGWLGLLLPILLLKAKSLQKKDWFYLSLIGATLLVSLGGNLPGFVFIQQLLPLGSAMRGPSIVLLITTLVFSLWIGDLVSRFKQKKEFKLFNILWWIGIISSSILIGIIYLNFNWLYQLISPYIAEVSFFTQEKFQLLITAFSNHLWFHLLFLGLSRWGLKKFKPLLIIALIGEMVFFTQGHLFFAPTSHYQIESEPIFAELNDPQTRVLTRNFNQDYTDYGAYWDALTIRQPFLDSYIDQLELEDWNHLKRMKDGLTPDWNMAYQIPMIHGYTTLLPQDMNQKFGKIEDVAINALPPISLENELLQDWAVSYYLVDTWFPYPTGVENLSPVATKDHWQLYKLKSLPRFRFTDGSLANMSNFKETPNRITFTTENEEVEKLIMADRYDHNWQVRVNDHLVELENYQGMRSIELQPGLNQVEFYYFPTWFYTGLAISGILALAAFVCLTRS